MHVDDAGHVLPLPILRVRLKMGALDNVAELVFKFQVSPYDLSVADDKFRRTHVTLFVHELRWSYDCFPQCTVTFELHLSKFKLLLFHLIRMKYTSFS